MMLKRLSAAGENSSPFMREPSGNESRMSCSRGRPSPRRSASPACRARPGSRGRNFGIGIALADVPRRALARIVEQLAQPFANGRSLLRLSEPGLGDGILRCDPRLDRRSVHVLEIAIGIIRKISARRSARVRQGGLAHIVSWDLCSMVCDFYSSGDITRICLPGRSGDG